MHAFLSKVFGRKKDDKSTSPTTLAPGELLDGKFEAVSPTVSPSATNFLELDTTTNGNDQKNKDKDVAFSLFRAKSRPSSPEVNHKKLDTLPHLSLNFRETREEVARELGFLLDVDSGTHDLLSDAVIGERRLNPLEALVLIQACSKAITSRGLETLGIMHPHWYSSSADVQRRLISHFIQSLSAQESQEAASPATLTSPASLFESELNFTHSPHDIAAVLRWGLRHLQIEGTSFGTDDGWYKAFLDAEAAAEYPPKAFSEKLAPTLPPAHLDLLTATLEIFSSLAAHAEANSTSGSKLSKLFGLWLLTASRVEDKDDWVTFYARWERTGRMLEHLFLARIRDESTDQRMPVRLLELVRKYPYTQGLSSPTTDLQLFPRPLFTTPVYDALFVRIEIEFPKASMKPKPKMHPLNVLADAFSTQVTEGEFVELWAKITAASKNGSNPSPLSNIFADETIRLLSIVPDEYSAKQQSAKSPTFSLLPVSPVKKSFSESATEQPVASTSQHKLTASEPPPATPVSPLAIGSDWVQFSSSGFLDSTPAITPLVSTLFDTDVEKTVPPSAVTLSRKSSKRTRSPRKSIDVPRLSFVEDGVKTHTRSPSEVTIQDTKPVVKASKVGIVQFDEAFIDFWSDSLLDPITTSWPTFIICKFKSTLVPTLLYGSAVEAQAQKTLKWLVLEQVYTVRPPAPPPSPPSAVALSSSPSQDTARPVSPTPSMKKRFNFFSRSMSASSVSSQKGKKKEKSPQVVGEMGELVEEEHKDEAPTTDKGKQSSEKAEDKPSAISKESVMAGAAVAVPVAALATAAVLAKEGNSSEDVSTKEVLAEAPAITAEAVVEVSQEETVIPKAEIAIEAEGVAVPESGAVVESAPVEDVIPVPTTEVAAVEAAVEDVEAVESVAAPKELVAEEESIVVPEAVIDVSPVEEELELASQVEVIVAEDVSAVALTPELVVDAAPIEKQKEAPAEAEVPVEVVAISKEPLSAAPLEEQVIANDIVVEDAVVPPGVEPIAQEGFAEEEEPVAYQAEIPAEESVMPTAEVEVAHIEEDIATETPIAELSPTELTALQDDVVTEASVQEAAEEVPATEAIAAIAPVEEKSAAEDVAIVVAIGAAAVAIAEAVPEIDEAFTEESAPVVAEDMNEIISSQRVEEAQEPAVSTTGDANEIAEAREVSEDVEEATAALQVIDIDVEATERVQGAAVTEPLVEDSIPVQAEEIEENSAHEVDDVPEQIAPAEVEEKAIVEAEAGPSIVEEEATVAAPVEVEAGVTEAEVEVVAEVARVEVEAESKAEEDVAAPALEVAANTTPEKVEEEDVVPLVTEAIPTAVEEQQVIDREATALATYDVNEVTAPAEEESIDQAEITQTEVSAVRPAPIEIAEETVAEETIEAPTVEATTETSSTNDGVEDVIEFVAEEPAETAQGGAADDVVELERKSAEEEKPEATAEEITPVEANEMDTEAEGIITEESTETAPAIVEDEVVEQEVVAESAPVEGEAVIESEDFVSPVAEGSNEDAVIENLDEEIVVAPTHISDVDETPSLIGGVTAKALAYEATSDEDYVSTADEVIAEVAPLHTAIDSGAIAEATAAYLAGAETVVDAQDKDEVELATDQETVDATPVEELAAEVSLAEQEVVSKEEDMSVVGHVLNDTEVVADPVEEQTELPEVNEEFDIGAEVGHTPQDTLVDIPADSGALSFQGTEASAVADLLPTNAATLPVTSESNAEEFVEEPQAFEPIAQSDESRILAKDAIDMNVPEKVADSVEEPYIISEALVEEELTPPAEFAEEEQPYVISEALVDAGNTVDNELNPESTFPHVEPPTSEEPTVLNADTVDASSPKSPTIEQKDAATIDELVPTTKGLVEAGEVSTEAGITEKVNTIPTEMSETATTTFDGAAPITAEEPQESTPAANALTEFHTTIEGPIRVTAASSEGDLTDNGSITIAAATERDTTDIIPDSLVDDASVAIPVGVEDSTNVLVDVIEQEPVEPPAGAEESTQAATEVEDTSVAIVPANSEIPSEVASETVKVEDVSVQPTVAETPIELTNAVAEDSSPETPATTEEPTLIVKAPIEDSDASEDAAVEEPTQVASRVEDSPAEQKSDEGIAAVVDESSVEVEVVPAFDKEIESSELAPVVPASSVEESSEIITGATIEVAEGSPVESAVEESINEGLTEVIDTSAQPASAVEDSIQTLEEPTQVETEVVEHALTDLNTTTIAPIDTSELVGEGPTDVVGVSEESLAAALGEGEKNTDAEDVVPINSVSAAEEPIDVASMVIGNSFNAEEPVKSVATEDIEDSLVKSATEDAAIDTVDDVEERLQATDAPDAPIVGIQEPTEISTEDATDVVDEIAPAVEEPAEAIPAVLQVVDEASVEVVAKTQSEPSAKNELVEVNLGAGGAPVEHVPKDSALDIAEIATAHKIDVFSVSATSSEEPFDVAPEVSKQTPVESANDAEESFQPAADINKTTPEAEGEPSVVKVVAIDENVAAEVVQNTAIEAESMEAAVPDESAEAVSGTKESSEEDIDGPATTTEINEAPASPIAAVAIAVVENTAGKLSAFDALEEVTEGTPEDIQDDDIHSIANEEPAEADKTVDVRLPSTGAEPSDDMILAEAEPIQLPTDVEEPTEAATEDVQDSLNKADTDVEPVQHVTAEIIEDSPNADANTPNDSAIEVEADAYVDIVPAETNEITSMEEPTEVADLVADPILAVEDLTEAIENTVESIEEPEVVAVDRPAEVVAEISSKENTTAEPAIEESSKPTTEIEDLSIEAVTVVEETIPIATEAAEGPIPEPTDIEQATGATTEDVEGLPVKVADDAEESVEEAAGGTCNESNVADEELNKVTIAPADVLSVESASTSETTELAAAIMEDSSIEESTVVVEEPPEAATVSTEEAVVEPPVEIVPEVVKDLTGESTTSAAEHGQVPAAEDIDDSPIAAVVEIHATEPQNDAPVTIAVTEDASDIPIETVTDGEEDNQAADEPNEPITIAEVPFEEFTAVVAEHASTETDAVMEPVADVVVEDSPIKADVTKIEASSVEPTVTTEEPLVTATEVSGDASTVDESTEVVEDAVIESIAVIETPAELNEPVPSIPKSTEESPDKPAADIEAADEVATVEESPLQIDAATIERTEVATDVIAEVQDPLDNTVSTAATEIDAEATEDKPVEHAATEEPAEITTDNIGDAQLVVEEPTPIASEVVAEPITESVEESVDASVEGLANVIEEPVELATIEDLAVEPPVEDSPSALATADVEEPVIASDELAVTAEAIDHTPVDIDAEQVPTEPPTPIEAPSEVFTDVVEESRLEPAVAIEEPVEEATNVVGEATETESPNAVKDLVEPATAVDVSVQPISAIKAPVEDAPIEVAVIEEPVAGEAVQVTPEAAEEALVNASNVEVVTELVEDSPVEVDTAVESINMEVTPVVEDLPEVTTETAVEEAAEPILVVDESEVSKELVEEALAEPSPGEAIAVTGEPADATPEVEVTESAPVEPVPVETETTTEVPTQSMEEQSNAPPSTEVIDESTKAKTVDAVAEAIVTEDAAVDEEPTVSAPVEDAPVEVAVAEETIEYATIESTPVEQKSTAEEPEVSREVIEEAIAEPTSEEITAVEEPVDVTPEAEVAESAPVEPASTEIMATAEEPAEVAEEVMEEPVSPPWTKDVEEPIEVKAESEVVDDSIAESAVIEDAAAVNEEVLVSEPVQEAPVEVAAVTEETIEDAVIESTPSEKASAVEESEVSTEVVEEARIEPESTSEEIAATAEEPVDVAPEAEIVEPAPLEPVAIAEEPVEVMEEVVEEESIALPSTEVVEEPTEVKADSEAVEDTTVEPAAIENAAVTEESTISEPDEDVPAEAAVIEEPAVIATETAEGVAVESPPIEKAFATEESNDVATEAVEETHVESIPVDAKTPAAVEDPITTATETVEDAVPAESVLIEEASVAEESSDVAAEVVEDAPVKPAATEISTTESTSQTVEDELVSAEPIEEPTTTAVLEAEPIAADVVEDPPIEPIAVEEPVQAAPDVAEEEPMAVEAVEETPVIVEEPVIEAAVVDEIAHDGPVATPEEPTAIPEISIPDDNADVEDALLSGEATAVGNVSPKEPESAPATIPETPVEDVSVIEEPSADSEQPATEVTEDNVQTSSEMLAEDSEVTATEAEAADDADEHAEWHRGSTDIQKLEIPDIMHRSISETMSGSLLSAWSDDYTQVASPLSPSTLVEGSDRTGLASKIESLLAESNGHDLKALGELLVASKAAGSETLDSVDDKPSAEIDATPTSEEQTSLQ